MCQPEFRFQPGRKRNAEATTPWKSWLTDKRYTEASNSCDCNKYDLFATLYLLPGDSTLSSIYSDHVHFENKL